MAYYPAVIVTGFENPLSDEEQQALGALVVHWAHVEMFVATAVSVLKQESLSRPRDRDISRVLTSFETEARARLTSAQDLALLDEFILRANRLAPERNLAVHGWWGRRLPSGNAEAVSWFRVEPPNDLKRLSASSLASLASEANNLVPIVYRLYQRLGIVD